MNVHDEMERLAGLWSAGALAPDERSEVSVHAAGCASCAAALRESDAFARWLAGSIAPDAPPADLEDRVVSRLGFRPATTQNMARRKGVSRFYTALAGVAAIIAFEFLGASFPWAPEQISLNEARMRVFTNANALVDNLRQSTRTYDLDFATTPPGKEADGDDLAGKHRLGGSARNREVGLSGVASAESDLLANDRPANAFGSSWRGPINPSFAVEGASPTTTYSFFGDNKVNTGTFWTGDVAGLYAPSTKVGSTILPDAPKPAEPKPEPPVTEMAALITDSSRKLDGDNAAKAIREAYEESQRRGKELASVSDPFAKDLRNHNAELEKSLTEAARRTPVELQDNRKIIRNADVTLEVEAYDAAYAKLGDIVVAEKGFVAGADTQRLANGKMKGTVTLRVPPDRFEAVLAKLRELGTVKNQNITTQDVSKAYVDLEARLGSKQTLVDRLKKVLQEAKGNVKELMEVEVQMGKTLEEIEAIKGELKYYDNVVGLSTIILNISEKDLGQPFEYVQRLQAAMGLTVRDADDAYAKAQKAVTDAGGQVVDSKMTRQSDGSAQGTVKGRVDAEKFPALRETLRALGHVTADTVNQQKTARGGSSDQPKPDAPVRREQAVLDLTISTAPLVITRKAQLRVETPGVDGAYQAARRDIEAAGGKILDGSLTGHTGGASAVVRAHVDADRFAALVDKLKAAGKVKVATVGSAVPPTAPDGTQPLIRERGDIELSIVSPPELIPEEHGLGRVIRDTFSGSVSGLLWSLEKLFVGLSLAGPWLALAVAAWLVWRRWRRARVPKPAGS